MSSKFEETIAEIYDKIIIGLEAIDNYCTVLEKYEPHNAEPLEDMHYVIDTIRKNFQVGLNDYPSRLSGIPSLSSSGSV